MAKRKAELLDNEGNILHPATSDKCVELLGITGTLFDFLQKKPFIQEVNLSDVDTLTSINCTGVYRVKKSDESYIGILIVTEDVQLRTVSQILISNIIPKDTDFGGTREPGKTYILTRGYSSSQEWSKWNYYGIYDNVITERTWWSSKQTSDELSKRYRSVGFAGVFNEQTMPSSTPGEGTSENVYFSTYLKCFCLKKGTGYFSRWDNSYLWNKGHDTDSPVAYSDCYYMNKGSIFTFNGTGLDMAGNKTVFLSEKEWNSLENKDENTLYYIYED